MRHGVGLLVYIWFGACSLNMTQVAWAATPPLLSSPPFAIMQQTFQEVLHLQFEQAFATAAKLEQEGHSSLEVHLTQGIIAYFQGQWQIRRSSTDFEKAPLAMVLEEGQRYLQQSPGNAWLQTILGLAAVFMTLEEPSYGQANVRNATLGRQWLQQAFLTDETMTDAHLGLGVLYFAKTPVPQQLVQRFFGDAQERNAEEALQHLRRASKTGHFSQELAQLFLLRLYLMEQRYEEAISLGQKLLEHYPRNGYLALWIGKSQCTRRDFSLCATTLGELAAGLDNASRHMARTESRVDLYYLWGQALQETAHYAEAFEAFRQAINYDPQTHKDESLWAKYYVATLYERRGAFKTARQIYRTLLRGRHVEGLHQQVENRLSRLP